MGGRIPEQIRRDVIRKWLLGVKRDGIAKETNIGKGTVSEIISQYSSKDSEVDLIRQVALAIRDLQTNVFAFSQALRLKNILNEVGLKEEEKIESLVTIAEIHCFKRGLDLQEFFDIVEKVASYSNELGIPTEDLPGHIEEEKETLEKLNSQIKDSKTNNLSAVLQNNEVTLRDLENYKNDKPVMDTVVEIQEELADVAKERDWLREQLTAERNQRITQKFEWLVPDHELDEANKILVNGESSAPIRYDELYRLANNLFRQPSKYVDVIKILRDRNLKFKKEFHS
jgi:type I site-specific restriction endonuclease